MLASFLINSNNSVVANCKTAESALAKFKVKGSKGRKEKRAPTAAAAAEGPEPCEASTTRWFHEFKPLPPPKPQKQKPKQQQQQQPQPDDSEEDDDDFDIDAGGGDAGAGGGGEDWGEVLSDIDRSSVDYDYADSEGEAGSDHSMPSSLGESSSFARTGAVAAAARRKACSKPVYTGPQLCAEEEDFD